MKKTVLMVMILQSLLYSIDEVDDERNLMSTRVTQAKSWAGAITHCNELETRGYSDWRLANATEILLVTYSTNSWSSTTVNDGGDTSKAMAKYRINPIGTAGIYDYKAVSKTEELPFYCVRSMR